MYSRDDVSKWVIFDKLAFMFKRSVGIPGIVSLQVIFTASAIDGDLGIPRKVLYSLLDGKNYTCIFLMQLTVS